MLTALQRLEVSQCDSLASLPDSIGTLTARRELKMITCSSLVALPDSIGGLTALTELGLDCSRLASLPASIGELTALRELVLINCGSLASLPASIGKLTALQQLVQTNCGSLASLPDSIGELTTLQQLDLINCGSLASLPDSIGELTTLQQLNLSNCASLPSLPHSITQLRNLKVLRLTACSSLVALPEGIGNLQQLRYLDVPGCRMLQHLPASAKRLKLDEFRVSYSSWDPLVSHGGKGMFDRVIFELAEWCPLPCVKSLKYSADARAASTKINQILRRQLPVYMGKTVQRYQIQALTSRLFALYAALLVLSGFLSVATYPPSAAVAAVWGGRGNSTAPAAVVSSNVLEAPFQVLNGVAFLMSLVCMVVSTTAIMSLSFMPVMPGAAHDSANHESFLRVYGEQGMLLSEAGSCLIARFHTCAVASMSMAVWAVTAACILVALGYMGFGAGIATVAVASVTLTLVLLAACVRRALQVMLVHTPHKPRAEAASASCQPAADAATASSPAAPAESDMGKSSKGDSMV